MTEASVLIKAVEDGLIYFEQAVELLDKEGRHAGGRPLGVKNSGLDKLDRAVLALTIKRSDMTAEEVAMSEARVEALLHPVFKRLGAFGLKPSKQKPKKPKSGKKRRPAVASGPLRRLILASGAIKEELAVVKAYRNSEDRPGMGRMHRSIRAAGRMGYKTQPEPIVDQSIEAIDEPKTLVLWGMEVNVSIQEDLGYEPVRRRNSGRGWLEPIELTREFVMTSKRGRLVKWVGAGLGRNGLSLHNIGIVDDPTIAECHQAALERDRCQEVERIASRRVLNTQGKAGEPMWLPLKQLVGPRPDFSPMPELVSTLVETEYVEDTTGHIGISYEVRELRLERCPNDPEVCKPLLPLVALKAWRRLGCPLPILDPPKGLVEFLAKRPDGPHIVRNMERAGKASVVWAYDGAPLRGTLEYDRWSKYRFWRPDALPIIQPPTGRML